MVEGGLGWGLCPKGTFGMSGDIVDYHTSRLGVLLESSGWKPALLPDVLQHTGPPQCQSVVLRSRNGWTTAVRVTVDAVVYLLGFICHSLSVFLED